MVDVPPTKQGKVLIELLRDRPHAWGSEIGVCRGETMMHLLRHLPRLERLYAVDPWEAYGAYKLSLAARKWRDQKTFDEAFRGYLGRILPFAGKVFILRAFSHEAAKAVPDQSLDFVFIDANHAYQFVREDIDCWSPKVKPGGIIAGHDYLDRPSTGEQWGVIRAVNETFGSKVHMEPHHVWWVEKDG